jgi:hypothetical protein
MIKTAAQAYALIGILMRRGRRTTFGMGRRLGHASGLGDSHLRRVVAERGAPAPARDACIAVDNSASAQIDHRSRGARARSQVLFRRGISTPAQPGALAGRS